VKKRRKRERLSGVRPEPEETNAINRRKTTGNKWIVVLLISIGAGAAIWWTARNASSDERNVVRIKPGVTFNKDIAPIVFNHCSTCHRQGQSGPFELLSYSDVKRHAKQIAELTERRIMPPWLPRLVTGNLSVTAG
jgi:hypothetical protein